MSTHQFYFEFSDEIQQILQDNAIELDDVVQQEKIDAEVENGILPFSQQGARSKGIVPIILATGAAATGVILSVSRLIRTLHEKPVYVSFSEPVEIRDTDGNVMTDVNGKPYVKIVKRFEMLEPDSAKYDKNLEFNFGNGIVVKFSTQKNDE
ncbi:hypothetical protein [Candidatus Albibeggiatoa sp. nov. NOAA]|uniref:hypothetical protein n=1 Tax=Candidatus Albibeggiatoa sp. nov. NOAA TaxID=3162724 RepID=UPI0032FE90F1|nr:hypothetical protein [Thiotrichaceae bacterium]